LIFSLDPELMGRGMAVIVLGFSIFLLIGWRYEGEKRLITSLADQFRQSTSDAIPAFQP